VLNPKDGCASGRLTGMLRNGGGEHRNMGGEEVFQCSSSYQEQAGALGMDEPL
jgi:hypothetical protein